MLLQQHSGSEEAADLKDEFDLQPAADAAASHQPHTHSTTDINIAQVCLRQLRATGKPLFSTNRAKGERSGNQHLILVVCSVVTSIFAPKRILRI